MWIVRCSGPEKRLSRTIAGLVAMILAVCTYGCDKQSGASKTAAPAPTVTAAPQVDPYQHYVDTIAPLLEEMQRMRILVEHISTLEKSDFDQRFREVHLRWDQVEPKLSAADRDYASWKHFSKAMEFLRQADKGFTRDSELSADAKAAQQPEYRPKNLDEMTKQGQQTVQAMKEAVLLERDLPRALAAAEASIMLAESDLKEKR